MTSTEQAGSLPEASIDNEMGVAGNQEAEEQLGKQLMVKGEEDEESDWKGEDNQLGFAREGEDSNLPDRQYRRWTPSEDALLVKIVAKLGPHQWRNIASHLPGREHKQCRERWLKKLSPGVNKDKWTAAEDLLIAQLVRIHGTKWSQFAQLLPGRTDNGIKNRWNSMVRKETRRRGCVSLGDVVARDALEAGAVLPGIATGSATLMPEPALLGAAPGIPAPAGMKPGLLEDSTAAMVAARAAAVQEQELLASAPHLMQASASASALDGQKTPTVRDGGLSAFADVAAAQSPSPIGALARPQLHAVLDPTAATAAMMMAQPIAAPLATPGLMPPPLPQYSQQAAAMSAAVSPIAMPPPYPYAEATATGYPPVSYPGAAYPSPFVAAAYPPPGYPAFPPPAYPIPGMPPPQPYQPAAGMPYPAAYPQPHQKAHPVYGMGYPVDYSAGYAPLQSASAPTATLAVGPPAASRVA